MKIKKFILVLTIICASTMTFADEVVLIVNPDNPVTTISARDAKNIFLGKKSTWSNGTAIAYYTQEDGEITNEFSKKYVKKTAQQFTLFWRKAIFTGKGTPPVKLSDSDQMKSRIASEKGAIGYILESEADSSVIRLQIQ